MKNIIITLSVMFLSLSGHSQNTQDILDKYILIKNALVNSDGPGAAKAAVAFTNSIQGSATFDQKDELLKSNDKLIKAGSDLEKQRAAFNKVSVLMWQLIKKSAGINHIVYYQYCPMKKAYWLSYDKEIKNPYYGSAMLTCGKVTETNSK